MRKKICVLSACIFLFAFSLGASELTLFDTLSVQGMGLGGCVSALQNDPDTLTANPAGMGTLSGISGSANYILGIDGTSYMDLTYGMPLPFGIVGANVSYMFINSMPNFDAAGTQLADLSAGDMLVTLGWGKSWGKIFSAGASVKVLSTRLDSRTGTAVALDAGIQFSPVNHLNVGVSVQNFGPGQTFVSFSSELPVKIRVGACYTFVDTGKINASGAVEVMDTSTQGFKTSVGVEGTFLKLLTLRVGYKIVNSGEYGLSTGLSLNFSKNSFNMGIDYALLPSFALNMIQAFGVRFRM